MAVVYSNVLVNVTDWCAGKQDWTMWLPSLNIGILKFGARFSNSIHYLPAFSSFSSFHGTKRFHRFNGWDEANSHHVVSTVVSWSKWPHHHVPYHCQKHTSVRGINAECSNNPGPQWNSKRSKRCPDQNYWGTGGGLLVRHWHTGVHFCRMLDAYLFNQHHNPGSR